MNRTAENTGRKDGERIEKKKSESAVGGTNADPLNVPARQNPTGDHYLAQPTGARG